MAAHLEPMSLLQYACVPPQWQPRCRSSLRLERDHTRACTWGAQERAAQVPATVRSSRPVRAAAPSRVRAACYRVYSAHAAEPGLVVPDLGRCKRCLVGRHCIFMPAPAPSYTQRHAAGLTDNGHAGMC